ncbi:hypothetical protein M2212_000980 [Bradyrhizobium elkanii]|nr:hypothetical protein [Bradyrhizobium elkanii]
MENDVLFRILAVIGGISPVVIVAVAMFTS